MQPPLAEVLRADCIQEIVIFTETAGDEAPRSGHACHVDLANIVDAKAQHRKTFESIANPHGEMARGITAKMADNPVRVNAPREDLKPLKTFAEAKCDIFARISQRRQIAVRLRTAARRA